MRRFARARAISAARDDDGCRRGASADGDAYANRNPIANAHRVPYPRSDGDAYARANRHGVSYAHAYTDGDADIHTDIHANPNSDPYANLHGDVHAHPKPDGDANANAHTNIHPNAKPDGDIHPNAYRDGDANANPHAHPNRDARSGLSSRNPRSRVRLRHRRPRRLDAGKRWIQRRRRPFSHQRRQSGGRNEP